MSETKLTELIELADVQPLMADAAGSGRVAIMGDRYHYVSERLEQAFGPYLTAGSALVEGYAMACCYETLRQMKMK